MKKLFLLLSFLLFSAPAFAQSAMQLCYTSNGSNCIQAVAAFNTKVINISTATTTEIVPLVVGRSIYVTSWDAISSIAGTMKFVYGTGTNCGTGTTDITGTYAFGASTVFSKGNGMGSVISVPMSNAICITSASTINVQGSLSYSQF